MFVKLCRDHCRARAFGVVLLVAVALSLLAVGSGDDGTDNASTHAPLPKGANPNGMPAARTRRGRPVTRAAAEQWRSGFMARQQHLLASRVARRERARERAALRRAELR
jgi:hypothetical protein